MSKPAAIAPPLVLASSSPRRQDLLAGAGVDFEVEPADLPEDALPGEAAGGTARRLAVEKATAVARRRCGPEPRLVLGADTLVVRDGEPIGKPRSAEHAFAILSSLVGRPHVVVTGVAVVRSDSLEARSFSVESRVTLRSASAEELRAYIATGEPMDKAGAYAFQGRGRRLVARVEGSESNVIGLPLEETLALLREAGLPLDTE